MKVTAILDIDEELLVKNGSSFVEEREKMAKAGITVYDYGPYEGVTYEYAAFAWHTKAKEYQMVGISAPSLKSCKARFIGLTERHMVDRFIDTSKVIYKKRSVTKLKDDWMDIDAWDFNREESLP